jgi:hypothetical protein
LKTKIFHFTLKNAVVFYSSGVVAVNSKVVELVPGAKPTFVSYNASAVKIYKATSSLVRFKNRTMFLESETKLLHTTTLAL